MTSGMIFFGGYITCYAFVEIAVRFFLDSVKESFYFIF